MPHFVKADDETCKLIERVMAEHHRDLDDADVTVQAVMAHPKVEGGTALKHHGVPAKAKVRIVQQKERALGMADAEVMIDAERWEEMPETDRVALVDHELTHLLVVYDQEQIERDENGEPVLRSDGSPCYKVKRDDGGRPRLRMRHHDYEFGWFTEVAERHGKYSTEVQQAASLMDRHGQVYFAFLADGAPSATTTAAERAVGDFVDSLKKVRGLSSVTISGGGKSATIRTDDGAGE